ncbi:MAG: cupredoxin domain-containing protein, partial [Methylohalobius sp.]
EEKQGVQVIRMEVLAGGYQPNHFVLKHGVPVKWVIEGKELTGCNRIILVPKLNLEIELKPGTQVIEFTPTEIGTIPWSCWMGMMHGTFEVIDEATAEKSSRFWIRRGQVRSSAALLKQCERCLQVN